MRHLHVRTSGLRRASIVTRATHTVAYGAIALTAAHPQACR
jgi:hypothetical protein